MSTDPQAVRAARARGEMSAQDLVRSCLDRIEAQDPHLSAWGTVDADGALAAARALDADASPGSLAGLPIGVKGNIAVAGLPLDAGSPAYAGQVAERDAPVVARLRRAGAVVLGTQRLHELAIGDAVPDGPWRTSRHPWNDDAVPGGSSCGSAVATAAGMCPASIGGDTGGSVRNPAASCGVVGFKPTTGTVEGTGVVPLCWSMDTIGYLGADVAVARALAEVVTPGRGWSTSRRDGPARIGVLANSWDDDVTDTIRLALEAAVGALGQVATVVAVPALPLARTAGTWQARMVELAAAHRARWAAVPDRFGPSVRSLLDPVGGADLETYATSFVDAAAFAAEVDEALVGLDVLLTPANPRPALGWDDWTGSGREESAVFDWYRFLWPFNVSGHPAVTVPWDLDPGSGVPRAVQLVGRRGDDAGVLDVATQVEAVAPGLPRPPRG